MRGMLRLRRVELEFKPKRWSQGPATKVSVRIEDEGPGVPSRIRQQIFDLFSFLPNRKELDWDWPLSKDESWIWEGEVDCVSPVANGRGTRFEVILPFEDVRGVQETPR